MTQTYGIYRISDGLFVGELTADEQHAMLNTPPGCALLLGRFDALSQRVQDGLAVPYKPERPSDDHIWDDSTRRWTMDPVKASDGIRRQQTLRRIEQLERGKIRPLGDLALNQDDVGARERISSIEMQLAELRKQL